MFTDDPKSAIGVFDSGLGGLTVVSELLKTLPNEDLFFFGDTARVPYGNKSAETIERYTVQIFSLMKEHRVKAVVAACNTVSALALEKVAKSVNVPVIGVVRPGATAAAKTTKNGRIGLIGTRGTVKSGLYREIIHEYLPDAVIYQEACPLFVPLVEEGLWNDPVTREIASRYLRRLKEENVDTLILGCTHYPLLRSLIQSEMGDAVTLINPAFETAKETKKALSNAGLLNENGRTPSCEFTVSDDPDQFYRFAKEVLGMDISMPKKILIEAYE